MQLEWQYGKFHGQPALVTTCGQYHVFWSDDACLFLADAPRTNSHGGWGTAREARAAMQKYEDSGQVHSKERD